MKVDKIDQVTNIFMKSPFFFLQYAKKANKISHILGVAIVQTYHDESMRNNAI